MTYANIYNKLKVIAEMEEHWGDVRLIEERLIKEGFYLESCREVHPDRLKTLRDQVRFVKEIKEILLGHKA